MTSVVRPAAARATWPGGSLTAYELEVHDDALLVVPPGEVTTAGKDHMSVFTPYFRKWQQTPPRDLAPTPRSADDAAGGARRPAEAGATSPAASRRRT